MFSRWRILPVEPLILKISHAISTGIVTVKITPLNRQLMMGNFQIPYSYLHSNVIMCIDVYICDHQISNKCREIFKYNTVIS
jgi:hypothetical protein